MEVGRNSDGLILPGAAEDDYEGRGTSPSLAPFLARLSRDERLGWSTKSRADDTESLNVNVSDCGSCHLSEVSSVSSWLNDASAVDDDYSSCAPDDESCSEKDDIDEEDEDDNGPEIRPLFLLQRCLEEKLLERQQNSDVLYPSVLDCAASAKSCELTSPPNEEAIVETSTIKRASRNLITFKSSETADNCVPPDGHSASDTNDVLSAFSQPMPLRGSGSRCNPDSLICTGAIYDFNLSSDKGNNKPVSSEVVNGEVNEDRQHDVSVQPQKWMHKPQCSSHSMRSLPSEASSIRNNSPLKDTVDTSVCFPTVPKHNSTDSSAVDSKPACQDSERNKSPVGTSAVMQHTHIANGSVCRKQINHSPVSSYNNNNPDSTSLKANHSNCQSTSLMELRRSSPSVKSKCQETLQSGNPKEKSMTVKPAEVTKIKSSGEANAENIDAASVVSDEAEKASDHACSVAMPMVEDGLSNSDISDVDEAFSMFAGLKPAEPVPVDTSFGAKSPVGSIKTAKDLDSNTADAHSLNM